MIRGTNYIIVQGDQPIGNIVLPPALRGRVEAAIDRALPIHGETALIPVGHVTVASVEDPTAGAGHKITFNGTADEVERLVVRTLAHFNPNDDGAGATTLYGPGWSIVGVKVFAVGEVEAVTMYVGQKNIRQIVQG